MKQFMLVWALLITLLGVSITFADGESHTTHESPPPAHDHSQMATEPASIINVMFIVILLAGVLVFFLSLEGTDLLDYPFMKRVMKHKWYPAILQIPTVIFFGFIVYYFFFGPLAYANNPGSVLSWTLWWPLVPLTFIMFGRLWCVLCPLPIIGDFVQKFVHPTRKPGQFLMKYGIWITDGIFIMVTLFDRLYGMVDTPWLSGIVFLLILFGTVAFSLRYERRTFCKHICFLGGVSGNYSMLSGVSIESKDKAVCASCKAKACYFGSGSVDGCPYFNVMPTKVGMRNCTLCANCIKACPKDNVAMRVRGIASELWSHAKVSFAESFFAKLMVGVVIIQNLGMLAVWSNMMDWVMLFGVGEKAAITLLYFTAIALPLGFMTMTSYISNRLQTTPISTAANFAAFGYAFIPIDVAGHLAHNLFHLLAEGKSVIGAFLGLFSGSVTMQGALTGAGAIANLQFAFITLGGLGTLYAAYRIARTREETTLGAIRILLPHAVLLIAIFAINIFLFTTPMVHRGG
ncbi:4Fe-4S binding protein [Candidatus Woesearchaeota archaeon]|nr:4Fe-4S binding protein [Candidatus Woesearchaeota archaeon]